MGEKKKRSGRKTQGLKEKAFSPEVDLIHIMLLLSQTFVTDNFIIVFFNRSDILKSK